MAKHFKKGIAYNPNGNGGFRDHPENRSSGWWTKEDNYKYWLVYFKKLSVEEFKKYKTENGNKMSMAAVAAYVRVGKTIDDLKEFQEVANRTVGTPVQQIELETNKTIEISIEEGDREMIKGLLESYKNRLKTEQHADRKPNSKLSSGK